MVAYLVHSLQDGLLLLDEILVVLFVQLLLLLLMMLLLLLVGLIYFDHGHIWCLHHELIDVLTIVRIDHVRTSTICQRHWGLLWVEVLDDASFGPG